jgi:hypothetical protein
MYPCSSFSHLKQELSGPRGSIFVDVGRVEGRLMGFDGIEVIDYDSVNSRPNDNGNPFYQ